MSKPKRILQVVTSMNRGGAETMLMNYYRALNKSRIQFDFLVHRKERGAYDDEIEALGGRIFRAPKIRPWTYLKYFLWLKSFFKEHSNDYVAVHGHIQENSGFAFYYAKKNKIERRIATSHIAHVKVDYKYIFRLFAKSLFNNTITKRIACGVLAGQYLYGKKNFQIFTNAIETAKYSFDQDKRNNLRKTLNIYENDIIVGHVGRFFEQKNHKFIIDIFYKFKQTHSNSKLVLIGEGVLRSQIEDYSTERGLSDSIIFTGNVSNVNDYLQIFDIFLMPSLYEGLPVSVIEAQASGLPCVLSSTIDKECDITGNVSFVSLNNPIEEWCHAIDKASLHIRKDESEKIKGAGYDVNENIKVLMSLYGCD